MDPRAATFRRCTSISGSRSYPSCPPTRHAAGTAPARRRTDERGPHRLVPLHSLFRARRWPERHELIRRFAAYGASHGAWDDAAGYVEGSLARIVEAALGQEPVLPSVQTEPGFLCGAEFASLEEEQRFLNERDL